MRIARTTALLLSVCLTGACQSSGSSSFLVFGGGDTPQGDLVERVRGAQDEVTEAREDYDAAFTLYQRLTAPQAVELDELSDDFTDSIESCEDRAQDLAERVEGIRGEADTLFTGWNEELTQFSGELLRRKSEAMMLDTQARAQRVMDALERVQTRTQPVLLKLQDYALFFHHNLNARAIATLQDTYKEFDSEFRALQAELGKAEAEIETFLTEYVEQQAAAAAQPQTPVTTPAPVTPR
jgi:chromosome segregation ATPase